MSDLPITSMDDVEVTSVYDSAGMSTIKEVKYCYWLLGSVHDEDALYMGTIKDNTPPSEHSLEKIKTVLNRVEPELIFPPLPFPWWHVRTRVTVADDVDANPPPHLYVKRPWIGNLDVNDQGSYVALWFANEIKQLEKLARCPPHPNLLRYHGCRVRKGRVTGALLGRVAGQDLHSHLERGGTIDKNVFFPALESAIDFLHNVVGLVHNDIHPGNIMVSPDGVPTLIDLGAAFPEGEDILWGIPFECWGDDPEDMDPETHFVGPLTAAPISRRSRDIASLNHLRTWVDDPVRETEGRRRRHETAEHFVNVANRLMQEARERAISTKTAKGNKKAASKRRRSSRLSKSE